MPVFELPTGIGCQFRIFEASVSTWGASVVRDPGTGLFHAHVAEFTDNCGESSWMHNSICAHFTSSHPLGPFRRVGVVQGRFCHNPSATMLPNGTWLLYHIGLGSPIKPRYTNCSGGATHGTLDSGIAVDAEPTIDNFTSVLAASSAAGPWIAHQVPTFTGVGAPSSHLDNPAPWPPRSFEVLRQRSGTRGDEYVVTFAARNRYLGCPKHDCSQLGLARGSDWHQQYTLDSIRVCECALCANGSTPDLRTSCEDPFVWIDTDGSCTLQLERLSSKAWGSSTAAADLSILMQWQRYARLQ